MSKCYQQMIKVSASKERVWKEEIQRHLRCLGSIGMLLYGGGGDLSMPGGGADAEGWYPMF